MPGSTGIRVAAGHLKDGVDVVLLGNALSSEVAEEDELFLKQIACEHHSWLLTPHTYAHAFRRGEIGIIGTAGTAVQHAGCLLSEAGFGVSRVYSVGARDLGARIRGLEFFRALEALRIDKSTKAVLVLLKPPASVNTAKLRKELSSLGKPLVVYVAGDNRIVNTSIAEKRYASSTLSSAVQQVQKVVLRKPQVNQACRLSSPSPSSSLRHRLKAKSSTQRYLRGFFSGGSCCDDSVGVLRRLKLKVCSTLSSVAKLSEPTFPAKHICVDLGSLRLANGRPHYPMIDLTLKLKLMEAAAQDPTTLLVLFDVFLGHGSHADPGHEFAALVRRADTFARNRRCSVAFVACVIGTDSDPQGFGSQLEVLSAAGVEVLHSVSSAAELAARIVQGYV